MKTFWNVMGCIGASIFSFLLVIVAVIFPLYLSATSFAQPKQIVDVVQNIDYTELLPDEEEWKDLIPEVEGISTESITGFLEHNVVEDVLELYAEDFLNATINGELTDRALNADALKALVNENMDELVAFVEPLIPDESEATTTEIAALIQEAVNTHADTIVEALPVPEPVAEGEEDPFALIRTLLDPTITISFCVALVVLVALVYGCRFKRFNGLLWLGIDSLIVALFLGGLAAVIGSPLIVSLLDTAEMSIASVLNAIIGVFTTDLTIAAVICGVLGIGLIVGYALLRRRAKASLAFEPVAQPIAES